MKEWEIIEDTKWFKSFANIDLVILWIPSDDEYHVLLAGFHWGATYRTLNRAMGAADYMGEKLLKLIENTEK